MQCPKCAYKRTESDSVVPDWQCPKCGIVYSKFRTSVEKNVVLTLTSGNSIEFNEIKLFDALLLAELNRLSAAINKNFRGFSTGLGFIGSLENVVVESLVTSAIEGIVSGAMATEGTKQIDEAKELLKKLRRTASFVSVTVVENIEFPQPESWRVPSFKASSGKELAQMPGPYITVKVEEKELDIFWDKVETYHFRK